MASSKNQHIDQIDKNLSEIKDKDALLTVGRNYLNRAKAQGMTRADLGSLLTETFGDDTTGTTR